MVNLWHLGLMSFDTAMSIQHHLVRRMLDSIARNGGAMTDVQDTLILVEHKPVYTIGLRDQTPQSEIEHLRSLGAGFRRTDRGGLITFHGPGQLVAYPVLHLKRHRPSVKWYVDRLEETVIRLCEDYELQASRSHDTGVWVGDNKIAAIGIHASRYVTSHGVAINCDTDLSWFEHIVPCGLVGKGVTSLTREKNSNINIEEVTPKFVEKFEEVFECKCEEIGNDEQREILNNVFMDLMRGELAAGKLKAS